VFDVRRVDLHSSHHRITGGAGGTIEGRVQRPEGPLIIRIPAAVDGIEATLTGEGPLSAFLAVDGPRSDPIEFHEATMSGGGVLLVLNAKR